MNSMLNKFMLGLGTYRQALTAIKIQYDRSRISDIQNSKLQSLINHCYKNIKYYRELFEQNNIDPDQFKSVADMDKIPILTKSMIRDRFWDFFPEHLPPCRISRTSGSTGIPLCIFSDPNSRKHNSAAVIRQRQAVGTGLFGRPILSPILSLNDLCQKPRWTFLQGIHKTYYINSYSNTEDNLSYISLILRKIKSPALIGLVSPIKAFAHQIRDGQIEPLKIKVVITHGEKLSKEDREFFETVFNCKVCDNYACNEAGDIAWQCSYGLGYHINADNIIVEIIRDGIPAEPGQTGEVVITNLNRYAMPIIRYKNGDLAKFKLQSCPCGRELPMLEEIVGRSSEDISLPGGKLIPWKQIRDLMVHPQIRQYQILQDENGNFEIKYVPESSAEHKTIEAVLLMRLHNILGQETAVRIKITDTIIPEKSGKIRYIVSKYNQKPTG